MIIAKLGRWPVCATRTVFAAVHLHRAIRHGLAATAATQSYEPCLAVLRHPRQGLRDCVLHPLAFDMLIRGDVHTVPWHTQGAAREAAGPIWRGFGRHRSRRRPAPQLFAT